MFIWTLKVKFSSNSCNYLKLFFSCTNSVKCIKPDLTCDLIKMALPRMRDSVALRVKLVAYCSNRSVNDAVALALHYILQHLESPNTYARLLFLDYSSTFNTIRPMKLTAKLAHLRIPTPTRNWILDLLTDRPQVLPQPQTLHYYVFLCGSTFMYFHTGKHNNHNVCRRHDHP